MPLRLSTNFMYWYTFDSLEIYQPACDLRAQLSTAWPQLNFCVICDIYIFVKHWLLMIFVWSICETLKCMCMT